MAGNQGLHSAENGKKGGRPKSTATIEAQLFRDALAKRIGEKSKKWMDAIEALALGHTVINSDGEVYDKSPDPVAWERAMSRAFGKPQESVDITSLGEQLPTPILNYVQRNHSNKEGDGDEEAHTGSPGGNKRV